MKISMVLLRWKRFCQSRAEKLFLLQSLMHCMSAYIGYANHVSGILVSIAVPGISCSYNAWTRTCRLLQIARNPAYQANTPHIRVPISSCPSFTMQFPEQA